MRICAGPDCDRVLVSKKIPADQRPAGTHAHYVHGLCHRCHYRAGRVGADGEWVPALRSRDEVMEDWVRCRARGMTKREAAAAMGMSFAAFDRAYWRARAAGDRRAQCGQVAGAGAVRVIDRRRGLRTFLLGQGQGARG